jgi:hypothetical protein
MKKFLFFVFGLIVFSLSTKAYYLSPASGTMQMGGTKTINIYAEPGTATDDVTMVRMTVVNATVTEFTAGPAIISSPGTCSGGTRFTANSVCVDLGQTSYITAGQLLGTFKVTWANTAGTATITKTAGSGYFNGTTTTDSLGAAGTYTLGTIPATPFTPEILPEIFLATGGLGMIFIGIYLFQYLKDEKKNFQEISY